MSATTATLAGRAAAERLMVDTCLIRRRNGETLDPDTLQQQDTFTAVYTGKCRVQLNATEALRPETGERLEVIANSTVQLPISVTGIAVGDQVVITASLDPDLENRVLIVRSLFHKTHATARRLACEEVQA